MMPAPTAETTTQGAFLGVARSETGRRWVGPAPEHDRQAQAMAQSTGLALALCQTLARLGVPTADAAPYLAPSLRDLLPDPLRLRDMGPAAERFVRALIKRERIAVFGDLMLMGGPRSLCW